MAFAIALVGLSSFISNAMAKEYGEDKKKIEHKYLTPITLIITMLLYYIV